MSNREAIELTAMLSKDEAQALSRLLRVASSDTGQSRRVANFLLAWWNAEECGGFALNEVWGLDTTLVTDIQTVFGLICRKNVYPDSIGLSEEFKAMVVQWRPDLAPPPPVWNVLKPSDGRIYKASLVTIGNAPGYRDVTVYLSVDDAQGQAREVEIQLGKDDSVALMHDIREIHHTAWVNGRPIDATDSEIKPFWLDTHSD